MPIEKIVPDAVTTPNPAWTTNPHLQLDADDTNYATAAGTSTGESFVVSFGNLTATNIDSINSIRFYINGIVTEVRGAAAVVSFGLYDSSTTNYYNETKTFSDTTLTTVQAGTERTTSDGSTAWTESDVNGLRIKVNLDSIANSSADLHLDHLYINVDYTIADLGPYDNTLNNIVMSSGTTVISGGTIVLD